LRSRIEEFELEIEREQVKVFVVNAGRDLDRISKENPTKELRKNTIEQNRTSESVLRDAIAEVRKGVVDEVRKGAADELGEATERELSDELGEPSEEAFKDIATRFPIEVEPLQGQRGHALWQRATQLVQVQCQDLQTSERAKERANDLSSQATVPHRDLILWSIGR
jgi:hypothetical protein